MSEDVRAALLEYFGGGSGQRSPATPTESTPLLFHGILDSIAVLELVQFLETRFGIEFSARDLDRRRLETIERIESLVREKLAQKDAGQKTPGA